MAHDPGPAPAAVFEHDGAWYRLGGAVRCLSAGTPDEVLPLLADVEAVTKAGMHAAGFVAYEAARAFGLAVHDARPGLPLAAFLVADRLEPFDAADLIAAAARDPARDWQPTTTREAYLSAAREVRRHLAAGDSYQVNLTFPLAAASAVDPFALFAHLARAQRSPGAAFLDFGAFAICSASPELFFDREGSRITMQPMKGTAGRGRTLAEDRRRVSALRRSEKERAENLMIVDMVRNDLGRIARIGSVEVQDLFRVARLPTLLQMTTTVTAASDAPLAEIFAATFPCASVTGAPKARTMSIIRDLEAGPRGVYTGAVGYVGPGGRTRFNVGIRTALVDRGLDCAVYGIGSGVVWDSRPGREYAECLAKARVLDADVSPFDLLETLRWDPAGGFALLGRHLRRLASSARYFGVPFDRGRVLEALAGVANGDAPRRVRLLLAEDGTPRAEAVPLPPAAGGPVRVGLARDPVDPADPLLFHKTTRRAVHEAAAASRPDCDQAVLWTPAGLVTETHIGNIAAFRDGRWVTPPVADGLLAGTMRAELLASGRVAEGRITVGDLEAGLPLAAFNSVRGWQDACFVPRPA